MIEPPRQASLPEYVGVLGRNWLLIAAITVVCAGAGFGLSVAQRPMYQARASFAVLDQSAALDGLVSPAQPVTTPDQLAALAQQAALSDTVLGEVKRAMRPQVTVAQLRSQVSATVEPDTDVVVVAADDHDARTAMVIANLVSVATIGGQAKSIRAQIHAAISSLAGQVAAVGKSRAAKLKRAALYDEVFRLQAVSAIAKPIVTSASLPTSPVSPKTARNTVILGLVGLILGLVVVLVRDAADWARAAPQDRPQASSGEA
jgi:capsular polysaccharide biosynthesis protein